MTLVSGTMAISGAFFSQSPLGAVGVNKRNPIGVYKRRMLDVKIFAFRRALLVADVS